MSFRLIAFALALIGCSSDDSGSGTRESPSTSDAAPDAPMLPPVCAACDGSCSVSVPITSANHVEGDIDYGAELPAGGNHNFCWTTWGVHTEPVLPENWVHNLEHGGIVLLYRCAEACPEVAAELATFAEVRALVVVSPQPDMTAEFAAVAWGYRLTMSCLDMDAIREFYMVHVDNAPESIIQAPPIECL